MELMEARNNLDVKNQVLPRSILVLMAVKAAECFFFF